MHPDIGKARSVRPLALGNLVFVVRENQIRTAPVNIKVFPEVKATHGRALDVPARPPLAPLRGPVGFARFGVLPKDKIQGIALGVGNTDACARAQIIDAFTREFPVIFKFADGVVHIAVRCLIRQALFFQDFDKTEHLGDKLRCTRLVCGSQAP